MNKERRVRLTLLYPRSKHTKIPKERYLLGQKTIREISPFNRCLSVVLQLKKRDHPEKSQAVFCPDKQRPFEPFRRQFGSCF